ncbi:hypothetical protein OK016_23455 [Vibrio chagasii]|nr:hypothetical protein [Vibrio chagasii]
MIIVVLTGKDGRFAGQVTQDKEGCTCKDSSASKARSQTNIRGGSERRSDTRNHNSCEKSSNVFNVIWRIYPCSRAIPNIHFSYLDRNTH